MSFIFPPTQRTPKETTFGFRLSKRPQLQLSVIGRTPRTSLFTGSYRPIIVSISYTKILDSLYFWTHLSFYFVYNPCKISVCFVFSTLLVRYLYSYWPYRVPTVLSLTRFQVCLSRDKGVPDSSLPLGVHGILIDDFRRTPTTEPLPRTVDPARPRPLIFRPHRINTGHREESHNNVGPVRFEPSFRNTETKRTWSFPLNSFMSRKTSVFGILTTPSILLQFKIRSNLRSLWRTSFPEKNFSLKIKI